MRANDYRFVSTDASQIVADLTAKYEELTGHTLNPADPDKLFISWVAGIIVQERVILNFAANQNIPSRAVGTNLDALGEEIYNISRPQAEYAVCTVRFTISKTQDFAVEIPSGTKITDIESKLVWHTSEDGAVAPGNLYADIPCVCESSGSDGNGYVPGQICKLIDVDKIQYFQSCSNIDTSHSGRETAGDDEYYELMRNGLEAYSTAGPKGAYEYHAKRVSGDIADVCAINPAGKPGYVDIFAIMNDGNIADEGTKQAILEACSKDTVRPLTDCVEVLDPEVVEYSVELTYYADRNSTTSLQAISQAVSDAVDSYNNWQCAKIGRDINPSQLMWLLRDCGAKRIDLKSPVFCALRDGSQQLTPQVAHNLSIKIRNGGYEDE